MTPCQKLQIQEGTAGRVESMQQFSATQSLHLGFWRLRKNISCSKPYLQCVYSLWHSVFPTSYFIFIHCIYIHVPLCVLSNHTFSITSSASERGVSASICYHRTRSWFQDNKEWRLNRWRRGRDCVYKNDVHVCMDTYILNDS